MNTQIKQSHLVIMQEILAFIQERGWDVRGIEIRRYKVRDGEVEIDGEDWKEKEFKWYLSIETEPRGDDEIPKRVKAGLND